MKSGSDQSSPQILQNDPNTPVVLMLDGRSELGEKTPICDSSRSNQMP